MQASVDPHTDKARSSGAENQFLTLRLGKEDYAIDIMKVQEIRSYEEPTRMVNAPAYVKGVVNLRGVIVPIIDLRMKLQIDQVEYNSFTAVIILNVRGTVIGIVVDSVSDVVTLPADAIKPAPQFEKNAALDTQFISGIADVNERMLIIMDMDAMLSSAELGVAASAAA